MTARRVLQEGLLAGLIGAGGVAVWFLVVDVIAGRAFFTPAMLGSAVFWGVRDPAVVEVAFPAIIGYTLVHVLAFVVVGVVASWLASLAETFPTTLIFIVFLFAIFEFGFYLIVALLAQPLLGALAWANVAIGNLIAAGGMGFYLWRVHPQIAIELARHPLGETVDGE